MAYQLTTVSGTRASPLALAAQPDQDGRCVRHAFDRGVNFFFFYGPGYPRFLRGLQPLIRRHRNGMLIATGSGARTARGLLNARRRIAAAAGTELLDVFFAEYISAADDPAAVFGPGGVLDQLQQCNAQGEIRFVGATTHDRALARKLAEDSRVDVLMHRLNMAHRKAVQEAFPAARRTRTPVVAFTATRWGTLLEPRPDSPTGAPRATDCYRYCLSFPAVHVVLSAPRTLRELDENLEVLTLPKMGARERSRWERFGDLIYADGRSTFETQWP
jgi:aryl-alcohol dehydrogenase-like predicted oxidoreductase